MHCFDLLHLHSKSISEIFVHTQSSFADRFKAKMAIMHITSDQTDSEQFQLVNMETSSSAYGRTFRGRRYSINLEDQRIIPVNPSRWDETGGEVRRNGNVTGSSLSCLRLDRNKFDNLHEAIRSLSDAARSIIATRYRTILDNLESYSTQKYISHFYKNNLFLRIFFRCINVYV